MTIPAKVNASSDTPSKRAAVGQNRRLSTKKARSKEYGADSCSEQFFVMQPSDEHQNAQSSGAIVHASLGSDFAQGNPSGARAAMRTGPESYMGQHSDCTTSNNFNESRFHDRNGSSQVNYMHGFLDQDQQQHHQQQQYPPPQFASLSQAELSLELLRHQLARSHQAAANAAFLSQFAGRPGPGLESLVNPNAHYQPSSLQGFVAQQDAQNYPDLRSFGAGSVTWNPVSHLDPMLQFPNALGMAQQNAAFSSLLAAGERSQREQLQPPAQSQQFHSQQQQQPPDIPAILIRHMVARGGVSPHGQQQAQNAASARRDFASTTTATSPVERPRAESNASRQQWQQQQQQRQQEPQPPRPQQPGPLDLPPCTEGLLESFMTRTCFPLAIDEDPNWLSEFHCFVRSELVEVFRATQKDVRTRNNSIAYQQVGIRCRFCAHMPPRTRTGRSSAFPSSMRQIYQSFTMMLRDHFGSCEGIPTRVQDKFRLLKDKPSQGATDSKRYWTYSAQKIGITDSASGLAITAESRAESISTDPFGIVPGQPWEDGSRSIVALVLPSDRPFVTDFLFLLLSQAQPIRLMEAECIGNRRNLRLGMPGFGCRYCCQHRRMGLSRMFPARRRTLPGKANDLYTHLRHCNVCPQSIKDELETLRQRMDSGSHADQGGTREFFNRVWVRIGHDGQTSAADSDDTV